MNTKFDKMAAFLASLFEIILIFTAVTSLMSKYWKNFYLSLIAISLLLFMFIIAYALNKRKLILPPGFQIGSVIFIFLALFFGEINNFYMKFWWWDLILHAMFGSGMVIVSLYLMKGIIKKKQDVTQKRFVFFTAIFAFSITIALGTMWELFEFAGDYFLKTGMIKGGLEDTFSDIFIKILASFIASTIYYQKNK